MRCHIRNVFFRTRPLAYNLYGDIQVDLTIDYLTGAISKTTWPNFLEQNSFESPKSEDNNTLLFILTNMKIIVASSPLLN